MSKKDDALKLALGALLSSAGCHDNPRSMEAIKTIREVLNSSQQPPTVEFEHPDVQIVYEILCSDESPPVGEHWEGFAARRVVEALAEQKSGIKQVIDLYDSPEQPAQPSPSQSDIKPWVHATTWRGLTDEERKRAIQFNNAHEALAVVIEAKLKEKNGF